jgi:site-specific DNA recombinase
VIRRLEHRGIRIVGVSDGYDSNSGAGRKLLRGVRGLIGLIGETYLDDLRAKTHRGLSGQIERGYHAGGLSYGYRSVVAGVNARGDPIVHRLEIEEAQAEIVRAIFTRYGGGDALRAMLGDVQLIEEKGALYGECDNAAERLLLAVGGVSMDLVAGAGFEPATFGL